MRKVLYLDGISDTEATLELDYSKPGEAFLRIRSDYDRENCFGQTIPVEDFSQFVENAQKALAEWNALRS